MTKGSKNVVESTPEEASLSDRIVIKVEEDGGFSINGEKKEIETLKPELLEQIVQASLDDCVDYKIEGETPIASFFQTLRQGTDAESELRKIYLTNNENTGDEKPDDGMQNEIDIDIEV